MALGPMAVVTHSKKTTTAGVPSVMCVGLEKVGPNPRAKRWRGQGVGVRRRLSEAMVCGKEELTGDEGPNEQRQAKDRHDDGLGHEHVPQTTDV